MKCFTEVERWDKNCKIWTARVKANTDINHLTISKATGDKILKIYIPVPHIFNIKNTVHLINDLLEIPYDQNLKFTSFDIANTYSNVPTNEPIKTIDIMREKHGVSDELKKRNKENFPNYNQTEPLSISKYTVHTRRRTCYGCTNFIYIFWNICTTHWKHNGIWHFSKIPYSWIFPLSRWHSHSIIKTQQT